MNKNGVQIEVQASLYVYLSALNVIGRDTAPETTAMLLHLKRV